MTEHGVGGLVGRDVHEASAAVLGRDAREGPRAEQVRVRGFDRVALEDRHVLVRGRVEHDVGPVALEDRRDARPVADVGEHRLGLGEVVADRFVEQALVAVEEQQPAGLEPGDLAGDLAADRPAGAGDEHRCALEVVGDLVRVDRRVLAAEEVGEVEVAQAAQERPADRGRTRGAGPSPARRS